MRPDIADMLYVQTSGYYNSFDGTTLSDIDNYQIEPLDLTKCEKIVQNSIGNPITELIPFTDSELTELLFGE